MNIVLLALSKSDSSELINKIDTLYPNKARFVSIEEKDDIDIVITRSIYIGSENFMEQMAQLGFLRQGRLLTLSATVEEKEYSESVGFSSLILKDCTDEEVGRWLNFSDDSGGGGNQDEDDWYAPFLPSL